MPDPAASSRPHLPACVLRAATHLEVVICALSVCWIAQLVRAPTAWAAHGGGCTWASMRAAVDAHSVLQVAALSPCCAGDRTLAPVCLYAVYRKVQHECEEAWCGAGSGEERTRSTDEAALNPALPHALPRSCHFAIAVFHHEHVQRQETETDEDRRDIGKPHEQTQSRASGARTFQRFREAGKQMQQHCWSAVQAQRGRQQSTRTRVAAAQVLEPCVLASRPRVTSK